MDKTKKLVLAGVLTALMLLMNFTPLGYIKIGVIEVTLMPIPVAVGAILLGPMYGLYFGGLFGATSFLQCFTGSVFGGAIASYNIWFAFLLCVVPRLLVGYLTGLIYRELSRTKPYNIPAMTVASLSTAAMNTVFFTVLFVLLFRKADLGIMNISAMSVWSVILSFITVNACIEILVCGAVSTPACKALSKLMPKFNMNRRKSGKGEQQ